MNNNFDIEQYVRNKVTPDMVSRLSPKEKAEWIKKRFGLTHGGTAKNKKKRRKK